MSKVDVYIISMNNFIETLIFGGIAVFIITRLISSLGKKNGEETRRAREAWIEQLRKNYENNARAKQKNVTKPVDGSNGAVVDAKLKPVPLAEDESAPEQAKFIVGNNVQQTIDRIGKLDSNFSIKPFMQGALYAFKLIYQLFVDGNLDDLKPLLAPRVYKTFHQQVNARINNQERWEFSIVKVNSVKLIAAELIGSKAILTLLFKSVRIEAQFDNQGRLLQDSSNDEFMASDEWKFERDLTSSDHKWLLAGTKSI